MRLVNPRCPGYVCESSVTIVVIKDRRRAFVCAGRATRFYAADRTIARRGRTESDIAAHVKIQAAIAGIIKKSMAGMANSPTAPTKRGKAGRAIWGQYCALAAWFWLDRLG